MVHLLNRWAVVPPFRACARLFPKRAAVLAILLLGAGMAGAQEWISPVTTARRLTVNVQVLGVKPRLTKLLAAGTLESEPGRPGTLTLPIDFALARSERATSLQVTVEPQSADSDPMVFTLGTEILIERPGLEPARNRRTRPVTVGEGGTILHVACENPSGETSITLVVTPEVRIVPTIAAPSPGIPVHFRVLISRTTERGAIGMEEAILHTMEGSPVSFSFRRVAEEVAAPAIEGPPLDAGSPPAPDVPLRPVYDELELTLLPKLSGQGILMVEATLDGRVHESSGPPAGRPIHLSKSQAVTWNGTFNLTVAPSVAQGRGYTFQVQAQF